MFDWLIHADAGLFRWINLSLENSAFTWLMPRVSDPPGGVVVLVLLLAWLAWKGGARGRVCAAMFLLALCFGDWLIVDTIKHAAGRLRPFHTIPETHLPVGGTDSFSMPSSHAANWFCAAFIGFVYYRRSVYWLAPLAALVGFSRIYNGVHYPSDVLAGALIGIGYSAALIWGLDAAWRRAGPLWFPSWWEQMPSLRNPTVKAATSARPDDGQQWMRLGMALAILFCVLRLAFLAAGKMELTEDEAYQWIWSKHPAMSYYSKPPLIAYTQFLGTHLWGDNEFGVRFFSPLITLTISLLLLRFMAREAGGRTAFVLFLACTVAPLLALGSILMTIDPLSVLFWTAAMIVGWKAIQPNGATRDWLWMGLWIGLGCLGKYTNLVQLACLAIFFCLWAPARSHLRKPGPWLALLIVAASFAPVVIWNAQHDWITVKHVASDGQLEKPWTRIYTHEFLLAEFGLLHPVFFIGAIWAAIAFWRRGRRDPLQLYLFSMGAPLFLMFFLLSWHSRILPNWIAPAVTPMFCLMAIYWGGQWQTWARVLRPVLGWGVGVGALAVVLAHDPHLLERMLHRSLPAALDPLRRAHGWKEFAETVGQARTKLETEGKPVFLIGEHYGFTGEATFYLPAAKEGVPDHPVAYFYATATPQNQFFFWPNYLDRKGENAIFFQEVPRAQLRSGWFPRWWHGDPDLFDKPSQGGPPPPEIKAQFQSVTDLGCRDVWHDGKVLRRVQFFACRGLR